MNYIKKSAILIIFLVATVRSGHAQSVLPSVPADSAIEAARGDTAIAIQRMFIDHRRKNLPGLLVCGVIVGVGGYSLATNSPETNYQRVATGGLGLLVSYAAFQLVQQVAQQRRYRPKREKQMLELIEKGRPLPPKMRRQLPSSYFSVKISTR